jgi:hypothetical protein
MGRLLRVAVISVLVLAVGAFGINDLNAICGFPGLVSASVFAGGTGYVVLYSPIAPFAFTGWASVPLGGVAGEAQFNVWLTAVSDAPTNFLFITGPAGPGCGTCALAGGPFGLCPGATLSVIYD